MINYDLLLINVPMLTLGTVLGVIMNEFLPDSIICAILVIVLLISLKKTLVRYSKQIKKERELKGKVNAHVELREIPSFNET